MVENRYFEFIKRSLFVKFRNGFEAGFPFRLSCDIFDFEIRQKQESVHNARINANE